MKTPHHKSGVTLVEVLIASAVTTLSVLALLGGFSVARKVVKAHSEALRADNIAFDLLWRRFHEDYDHLASTIGKQIPYQDTSLATSIYHSSTLGESPKYKYYEYTEPTNNLKLLKIKLLYGSSLQYSRELEVLRSEIPRTIATSTSTAN